MPRPGEAQHRLDMALRERRGGGPSCAPRGEAMLALSPRERGAVHAAVRVFFKEGLREEAQVCVVLAQQRAPPGRRPRRSGG